MAREEEWMEKHRDMEVDNFSVTFQWLRTRKLCDCLRPTLLCVFHPDLYVMFSTLALSPPVVPHFSVSLLLLVSSCFFLFTSGICSSSIISSIYHPSVCPEIILSPSSGLVRLAAVNLLPHSPNFPCRALLFLCHLLLMTLPATGEQPIERPSVLLSHSVRLRRRAACFTIFTIILYTIIYTYTGKCF